MQKLLSGLFVYILIAAVPCEACTAKQWRRIFALAQRNLDTHFSILPTDNPSPMSIRVLKAIQAAGGDGRHVIRKELVTLAPASARQTLAELKRMNPRVNLEEKFNSDGSITFVAQTYGAVEVTKPPEGTLLGSKFKDVYQEFADAGVPTLVLESPMPGVMAQVNVTGTLTAHQQLTLEISPWFYFLSNNVMREEQQHLRDAGTHQKEFLESLPPLPPKYEALVQKMERNEELTKKDQDDLMAVKKYWHSALEVKAKPMVLARSLTFEGLRETFGNKKVLAELVAIQSQALNLGFEKMKLANAHAKVFGSDSASRREFSTGVMISATVFGGMILEAWLLYNGLEYMLVTIPRKILRN